MMNRLEAAAQPVAEVKTMQSGGNAGLATVIHEIYNPERERLQPGDKLYTHPAPTQQPVLVRDLAEILGATVPEVCDALAECGGPRRSINMAVSGVEALAVAAQLKKAAEPVAWGLGNTAITGSNRWMMLREQVPADDQYGGAMWTPLYTHPAPTQQPLTDDELRNVLRNTNHMIRNAMYGSFWPELEQACRAIEAAHGITGSKT